MKLVICIVHKDDAEGVVDALVSNGFRATTLSTTGGFLREGNATILIGIPEEAVSKALDSIKENTRERVQRAPALLRLLAPQAEEVRIGAATVFVLDLEEMVRF